VIIAWRGVLSQDARAAAPLHVIVCRAKRHGELLSVRRVRSPPPPGKTSADEGIFAAPLENRARAESNFAG
jgi:hypothetical protein